MGSFLSLSFCLRVSVSASVSCRGGLGYPTMRGTTRNEYIKNEKKQKQ